MSKLSNSNSLWALHWSRINLFSSLDDDDDDDDDEDDDDDSFDFCWRNVKT